MSILNFPGGNKKKVRKTSSRKRTKKVAKPTKKVERENYLETYKKMMGLGARPINDKPISEKGKKFFHDW